MQNKLFGIAIIIMPGLLFPCAVCYGNPDAPMSHGMNMGILTLMGFIFFILAVIISSIICISIRTKNINNS